MDKLEKIREILDTYVMSVLTTLVFVLSITWSIAYWCANWSPNEIKVTLVEYNVATGYPRERVINKIQVPHNSIATYEVDTLGNVKAYNIKIIE